MDRDMVHAYGRFETSNGCIFRTQAYLRWGESDQLFGLLVMLNPGASKLMIEKDWNSLVNGRVKSVDGPIVIDQTMQAVIDIINTAYPNLDGRLEIKNLFNLRDGNIDNAMTSYNEICSKMEKQILHTDFDEKPLAPWVWLGWGYDASPQIIKLRKQEIYNKIKSLGIPLFKVTKSEAPEYLVGHVKPQLMKKRKEYGEEIVKNLLAF